MRQRMWEGVLYGGDDLLHLGLLIMTMQVEDDV